jgi:hypothetical protein
MGFCLRGALAVTFDKAWRCVWDIANKPLICTSKSKSSIRELGELLLSVIL